MKHFKNSQISEFFSCKKIRYNYRIFDLLNTKNCLLNTNLRSIKQSSVCFENVLFSRRKFLYSYIGYRRNDFSFGFVYLCEPYKRATLKKIYLFVLVEYLIYNLTKLYLSNFELKTLFLSGILGILRATILFSILYVSNQFYGIKKALALYSLIFPLMIITIAVIKNSLNSHTFFNDIAPFLITWFLFISFNFNFAKLK